MNKKNKKVVKFKNNNNKKIINNSNIKKYAGRALLTVGAIALVGHLKCISTNHGHELCPLTHVFGLEHQANKVNNNEYGIDLLCAEVVKGHEKYDTSRYNVYNVEDLFISNQKVIEYANESYDVSLDEGDFYTIEHNRIVENAIPIERDRVEIYEYNKFNLDEKKLERIIMK